MGARTRAELLKIRSTRTTFGLVVGMVLLVLLFVLLTGLLEHASGLEEKSNQHDYLAIGTLAALFAALAGVLVVTSEYRFGTIRPTFLFTPRRSRVVEAKLAASLIAGLVFAAVAEGLAFGIGYVILSGRGIPIALNGGDVALLVLGTLGSCAVWGAIGVGLGTILRNQVGSVIGLLAWSLLVENLLFGLVPSVGRYTPGRATDAVTGSSSDHLLSPAVGGVVLVAWAAALAAGGLTLTARRDVD